MNKREHLLRILYTLIPGIPSRYPPSDREPDVRVDMEEAREVERRQDTVIEKAHRYGIATEVRTHRYTTDNES